MSTSLVNSVSDSAMLAVSALSLSDLESLIAQRKEAEAQAEAERAQARIDSVLEYAESMGFDDATMERIRVALIPPVAPTTRVRIGRNGQPVPLLVRKDGTVNTVLSGEGLLAHTLADGTRTLAEIAAEMGTMPRTGQPYTAGYVRSWLTSGGNGKRGYTVTYDGAGRVTSHAPTAG